MRVTPGTGGRPPPPRRDRECHPRPQVWCRAQSSPSGRFAANAAWLAVQVLAHNLARWAARIGLGEELVTTRPSGDASSPWLDGSPARCVVSLCIFPSAGPGLSRSLSPWPDCELYHSQPDGAVGAYPPTRLPNGLAILRQAGLPASLAACCAANLAHHRHCRPSTFPFCGHRTLYPTDLVRIKATPSRSGASHPLPPRHGHIPSVDSGLTLNSEPPRLYVAAVTRTKRSAHVMDFRSDLYHAIVSEFARLGISHPDHANLT